MATPKSTRDNDHSFKIVVIGDSSVGKSNLMRRYVDDTFDLSTQSTIGVSFYTKTVTYESKTIQIQLWDTAGQERFKSIVSSYYRGAHGVIIVYDITNRDSFQHIEQWYIDLKQHISDDVPIILVGSKSDLSHTRQVSTKEAATWAETYNMSLIETSALSGENISLVFTELVMAMVKSHTITQSTVNDTPISVGKGINIDDTRTHEQIIADNIQPGTTVHGYGAATNVRKGTVDLRVSVSVTKTKGPQACSC